jgi:hypothetical protein
LNVKVTRNWRQDVYVPTGGGNLERLSALALSVNVDELTWLYAERWAVNSLTIYENVTVYNHLTSL